jgi:hypothetical protein
MTRHALLISLVVSTGCLGDNGNHGPQILDIEGPTEIDADGGTATIKVHVQGEADAQLSVAVDAQLGMFSPQSMVVITDHAGAGTFVTTYTAKDHDGNETIVANVTDFSGHASSATLPIAVKALAKYGEALQLPNTGTITANFLEGQSITVPTRGVLKRIGMFADDTTDVVIGIYSDNNGAPKTLLAQTSASIVAGRNEIAIEGVDVPAGSYWFMANYKANATIYMDSAVSRPTRYISTSFSASLPDTMPTTTTFSSATRNYYLVFGRN